MMLEPTLLDYILVSLNFALQIILGIEGSLQWTLITFIPRSFFIGKLLKRFSLYTLLESEAIVHQVVIYHSWV